MQIKRYRDGTPSTKKRVAPHHQQIAAEKIPPGEILESDRHRFRGLGVFRNLWTIKIHEFSRRNLCQEGTSTGTLQDRRNSAGDIEIS